MRPTLKSSCVLHASSHSEVKNTGASIHAYSSERGWRQGLSTRLSRECNSQFGHDRDKWLGEYLNFIRSKSLLDSRISKGKLALDGVEFGGDVRQTETGK